MRVGRAKRRYMRWARYVQHTRTGKRLLNGYLMAHYDAMYAHTWAPKGVRTVYFAKWMTR